MEKHRYRHVLLTLAFSLLVIFATHQSAALIYGIAKACLISLSWLLFAPALYRVNVRQTAPTFAISETLALSFRFQRPPPIPSL